MPGLPKHGLTRYRKYGCRCDVCRAANTAMARVARERRRARAAAFPETVAHGTNNAYIYDGCRCGDCREAARLACIRYRGGLKRPVGGDPGGG